MKKVIVTFIVLYLLGMSIIAIDGVNSRVSAGDEGYYGIIYGSKVELSGEPSERLQARLDAGIDLYARGVLEVLIVSGGIGVEGYDEAKVMKDYLVEKGVQEADILVDSEGYTTKKTSENVWNMISIREENPEDIGIIGMSQFYHISRVKLSLRQSGFEDVYGYAPEYFELRDIYSLFREVPAYLKYHTQ